MKRKFAVLGLALALAMLAGGCGVSGGETPFGWNVLYARAAADEEAFSRSLEDEDAAPEGEEVLPDDKNMVLPGLRTAMREEALPGDILDPVRGMPIIEMDGECYVGYVDIPALDLSLPVMASWSYPRLKISPCRYTGSVYYDDMVLMAHNYARHFGGLKNLTIGDEVRFTDGDGNVFVYQVAAMEILDPSQVEEMTESGWDLSLFTCTVGGERRVTVRCTRVSEELAG